MTNPLAIAFAALAIGARFVRSCLPEVHHLNVKVSATEYVSDPATHNPCPYSPLGMYEQLVAVPTVDVSDVLEVPTVEQIKTWIGEVHTADKSYCDSHFNLGSISSHCSRLASFCSPELSAYMASAPSGAFSLNTPSEYHSPYYTYTPEAGAPTLDAYKVALERERAVKTAFRAYAVEACKVYEYQQAEAKRQAVEAQAQRDALYSALANAREASPIKGKYKGKVGRIFWRGDNDKGARAGLQFTDGHKQFFGADALALS